MTKSNLTVNIKHNDEKIFKILTSGNQRAKYKIIAILFMNKAALSIV